VPYAREEVLSDRIAEVMTGLAFDDEILGWLGEARKESHGDER